MTSKHPPYTPDLSPSDFFLFLRLKIVLEGQRLASAEEVTAKATTALEDVSKNGFQECFQKLYERWQKRITVQGNYFQGNVLYIDVKLLISVQ
jgi:histone-lysine N-methyltransferase SETMAR